MHVFQCMSKAHAQDDCCEAMHAFVGVCVWACTRRMPTVIFAARRCMHVWELCTRRMLRMIAARLCMHVWECASGLVQGACSQSLLLGDACVCQGVCLGLCKAHAPCDCCEAMHACACLCVLMHEAHAHCDCCEAMHACVGVCV